MPFKINIAEKSGKTYKLETEVDYLNEKALKDKIDGKEISPDLEGYEFEITGASDKSGFPALTNVDGFQKRKVLLGYGKGMKKRPKREGKKKQTTPTPGGLRLRKTVRGKVISPEIIQINLKLLKEGSKKLSEVFPDQNKPKEVEPKPEEPTPAPETEKPAEAPTKPVPEAPTPEPVKEEVKEEIKSEEKSEEKKNE